mmetsp:Transcript_6329/g.15442  ORF Transcript_6329/g.15442 Transcript_6329/m.15442 type:complete len:741 (+) Transcript_6329:87-2309(+)
MAASSSALDEEGAGGSGAPLAKRMRAEPEAGAGASLGDGMGTPTAAAPGPGAAKVAANEADEEAAVTLLDDEAGEEGAGASSDGDGVTAEMLAEEEKLHKETEAEQAKELEEHRRLAKNTNKKTIKEKVQRLNSLLEKSIVYSEFLSNKLKNPSNLVEVKKDATGVGKSDGIVASGMGRLPQPGAVEGGAMRDYQLVGVHWLTGLYENGLNGILGDEMGLGKTVQTIGFLAFLRERQTYGPFLIVGPLSTIGNWHNEFKKWAPSIPSLVYHGSKEEREELLSGHMRHPDNNPNFPVIITSYEIVLRDFKRLSRFKWKFLVVDEGHRLKNLNCKLIHTLKALNAGNRLLLSGTPLQNNLTELWSLLNFLLPDIFDDLESFQQWFDFDVTNDGGEAKILQEEEERQVVTKLHLILKPFLLRRLKADVDLTIPPKFEYVLYCDPTEVQRNQYIQILDRELVATSGGIRLNNILMQLRKCCNHPFLFEWPTDEGGQEVVDERIVTCCGKMVLLDRIMTKLREEGGHQVLIFSQMTQMLNILEDYCEMRGFTTRRLDGSVAAADRLKAMNEFNQGEADVFLLSTRAGGLGVNLVAADTCIIFDSDWNPHADLQAQDRCHRIGQQETVLVFRLATADTVEEAVLEAAKHKLRLEQLVISRGKYKMAGEKTNRDDQLKRKDLQALLAYDPAKAALGKGRDGSGGKTITDEELAAVMDRSGEAASAGHGFAAVDKVVSKFDMQNREEK